MAPKKMTLDNSASFHNRRERWIYQEPDPGLLGMRYEPVHDTKSHLRVVAAKTGDLETSDVDDEFPLPLAPIHNIKSSDISFSTSAFARFCFAVACWRRVLMKVPFRRAGAKLNPARWFSAYSVMESPKRMIWSYNASYREAVSTG